MVFTLQKCAILFGAVGLFPTAYFAYDGYLKSVAPSNFELASKRLGFVGCKKSDIMVTASEQQEALLKQLQMAGYFQQKKLWVDLNRMGVEDPVKAFKDIYYAVKKSNADQSDPSKFDAKILRKNLGKNSVLDQEDVKDFILLVAQNAFGRKAGQERTELSSYSWMEKCKNEYLDNAKILNMIDRELPEYKEYDAAWIAGASRIGLLARVVDYHNTILKYNIKINGETSVLAGARPLWAEIDGINPAVRDKLIEAYKNKTDVDSLDVSLSVGVDADKIAEGKEYIKGLAEKYDIKLDASSPFIQYKTKEECPSGYHPGRIYPNYAEGESKRLTETVMSQDLISTYIADNGQDIAVVDTQSEKHNRPDTASTARDGAMRLINDIKSGKYGDRKVFNILFETNNPYIERQTIVTQREVNKVLEDQGLLNKSYLIKVDGVGSKCMQDVPMIHSELAALIAERWKNDAKDQVAAGNAEPKRPIEVLLFQNSEAIEQNMHDMPEIPVHQETGGWWQDFFDKWLP